MRRSPIITSCLLFAACGPRSEFHDYTTAERAAKSFVEAGRIGDMSRVRASLVAAERDQEVHCDYGTLGPYKLVLDRQLDPDHVVVMLQNGTVSAPLACVREQGAWKVSIHGSLSLMKARRPDQPGSTPR